MSQGWRPFVRIASRADILEARIAEGGEKYGHHPTMQEAATAGQWLCRNPDNGHTWSVSEEGMYELYAPVDKDDPEWKALATRMKPKKKKRKGSAEEAASEKVSLSYDPAEAGPLFFEEDDDEGKKEG